MESSYGAVVAFGALLAISTILNMAFAVIIPKILRVMQIIWKFIYFVFGLSSI